MSILRLIKTIGKDIESRYEYVNCGGCGVVALLLGRRLQSLGVDCEVVIMGPNNLTDVVVCQKQENNRLDVEELRDQGFQLNHILVRFEHKGESVYADSEGIYKSFDDAVTAFSPRRERHPTQGVSFDDLEVMVRDRSQWNDKFNRKQIPGITATIAKHFRKYKKTNKKKWWRVA